MSNSPAPAPTSPPGLCKATRLHLHRRCAVARCSRSPPPRLTRRSASPSKLTTAGLLVPVATGHREVAKTDRARDDKSSQISRRQLLKYASAGATLVAAGPMLGAGEALAHGDKAAEREDRTRRGDSRNRAWRAGDHHQRDHGQVLRPQLCDVHGPRWPDAFSFRSRPQTSPDAGLRRRILSR
jgi:hypothetical protein